MTNRTASLSIQYKVIGVVVTAIILLALMLYGISENILPKSYTDIERDALLKDLGRANDAIGSVFTQLDEKLTDWSAWDDTYEFVVDRNDDYRDSNLQAINLANLKINAMVFVSAENDIAFIRGIDMNTVEEVDSTDLGNYILAHRDITNHTDIDDTVSGILPLPSGPFMAVSKPILNSKGEGPIHGTLIFGKYLNTDVIDTISRLTNVPIEIFPYNNFSSPADVKNAEQVLAGGEESVVSPLSSSTIAAYKILNNLYGEPLLTLKITESRPIYTQGRFTSNFFIKTVSALLLIFGLILTLALEQFIISRFTKLSNDVKKIGLTQDLSLRVRESANDEIGELATSINGMLDKIASSHEAEQQSNEKIRVANEELQQRFGELERINKIMVDREVKMVELKKEIDNLKAR